MTLRLFLRRPRNPLGVVGVVGTTPLLGPVRDGNALVAAVETTTMLLYPSVERQTMAFGCMSPGNPNPMVQVQIRLRWTLCRTRRRRRSIITGHVLAMLHLMRDHTMRAESRLNRRLRQMTLLLILSMQVAPRRGAAADPGKEPTIEL